MKPSNFVSGQQGLDLSSAIEAMIKRSCIIDFGIVQEVVADGVVNVSLAVSSTKQDMICMTCVLANIASSNFTLKIVPNAGDRVLVVYPRIFHDKMFNINGNSSDTEIIVDKEAKGYNLSSGIAILLNQYKSKGHKKVLTIDENITLKHNNTELVLSKDDEITVNNGKAEIKVDSMGNVTVDAKSGKLSLKNASTDLYTILNGILNILNTSLKTTGTSSAQTVVPQQFSMQAIQLGQLMQ